MRKWLYLPLTILIIMLILPARADTPTVPPAATTITSSGISVATRFQEQRKIFTTPTGTIFMSYCDSNDKGQYSASGDGGATWTATQVIGNCKVSVNPSDGGRIGLWYDGSFVYFVTDVPSECSATNVQLCYKVGTISGTIITFDAYQAISIVANGGGTGTYYSPAIITDSKGRIWIVGNNQTGTNTVVGVASCTCTGQGTWVNATGFPTSFAVNTPNNAIEPLTNGKVALFTEPTNVASPITARTWSGTAWSSAVSMGDNLNANNPNFSTVSTLTDDFVLITYNRDSSQDLKSIVYRGDSNTWDSPYTIVASAGYNSAPSLSYDLPTKAFYAFWLVGSTTQTLYYATLGVQTGISRWSDVKVLVTGETSLGSSQNVAVAHNTVVNVPRTGVDVAPVIWVAGTTNIRYIGLEVFITGNRCVVGSSCLTGGGFNFQTGTLGPFTLPIQLLNPLVFQGVLIVSAAIVISSMIPGLQIPIISQRRKRNARRSSLI